MTRHEFLALVVASPLAVLFGRRKQEDEGYGMRMDFVTYDQVEPLTATRMQELSKIGYPARYFLQPYMTEDGHMYSTKHDIITGETTIVHHWRINEI